MKTSVYAKARELGRGYSVDPAAPNKKRKRHRHNFRLQRGMLEGCAKGIELEETLGNLRLQEYLPSSFVSEVLLSPYDTDCPANCMCLKGCAHEVVSLMLDVDHCGSGYFLKGAVFVNLRLECTRCGAQFYHPVQSSFQVWANPKINSLSECIDPNELPFPRSANYLDISPSVAAAIESGLPRLRVCGTPECVSSLESTSPETEQRGWTTEPETVPNAFACLKDLRDSLSQDLEE